MMPQVCPASAHATDSTALSPGSCRNRASVTASPSGEVETRAYDWPPRRQVPFMGTLFAIDAVILLESLKP